MPTRTTKTANRAVSATSDAPRKPGKAKPVKLLSGGNPQIAKAHGDAPVKAYIAGLIGIVALDTIQVINPLIAGVIVFLAGQRASRRDMTRG